MADCYIMQRGETVSSDDLSVVIDEKRNIEQQSNGYKILENGVCVDASNYRIDKYTLSSLSQIYIKIDDPECVFTWQSNSNVPYNSNPNLVGDPVVSGKSGFYNVPKGAIWICFGVKNTDTVTGIYNYYVNGVPIVNE